jgi:hypothetical protein
VEEMHGSKGEMDAGEAGHACGSGQRRCAAREAASGCAKPVSMAALCWWDEEEERHRWAGSAKGRGPGRESIQGLVANGPDWPVGSAAWAMKASWVAKKSKKKRWAAMEIGLRR